MSDETLDYQQHLLRCAIAALEGIDGQITDRDISSLIVAYTMIEDIMGIATAESEEEKIAVINRWL